MLIRNVSGVARIVPDLGHKKVAVDEVIEVPDDLLIHPEYVTDELDENERPIVRPAVYLGPSLLEQPDNWAPADRPAPLFVAPAPVHEED